MDTCKVPTGLVPALHEAGVSLADVLAAAGLPSGLLDMPGQRVSVSDYFAFWNGIRAASGDPSIGLFLATSVKPDLTEPFFLAVLSASDGAAALQIVSAYKRILTPQVLEISSNDRAGEVVVTYDWPEADDDPPQVLIDAELAFIVEMCRRGTRNRHLAPRGVHLRRAALEAGADHAAFFACPLRLRARHDAIVFAAEDVATRFSTHNPQMLDVLLPYLKANTPASTRSAVSRVRSAIAERLRGRRPTLQAVSKQLAMSGRVVQRILSENGTSFRQLLDEVRNQHAQGYLAATAFTDSEVAFLLGFEDPNSFYRAFRAWNGKSPSEFRQRPKTARRMTRGSV